MAHRHVLVTVKLRIALADDYSGEIPNDVEKDLRYDLEQGRIREGLDIKVQDVFAGGIDDDRPLPIPEGASVGYTDDEGGEWAAVVLQHLPDGRYDIRLSEAHGKKVIASADQLEEW